MVLVALGILGVVVAVDALTTFELGFSAFYLLPVLIVSWAPGWRVGLGSALLSATTWYGVDLASGHPYSCDFYRLWDGSTTSCPNP